jgi:hypothetical protein
VLSASLRSPPGSIRVAGLRRPTSSYGTIFPIHLASAKPLYGKLLILYERRLYSGLFGKGIANFIIFLCTRFLHPNYKLGCLKQLGKRMPGGNFRQSPRQFRLDIWEFMGLPVAA